ATAGPGPPSELRRAAVRAPTKTLVDDTPSACYNEPCSRRGQIAQPVRALRSHRRGRGFESLSAHQVKTPFWSRFPEGRLVFLVLLTAKFGVPMRQNATMRKNVQGRHHRRGAAGCPRRGRSVGCWTWTSGTLLRTRFMR